MCAPVPVSSYVCLLVREILAQEAGVNVPKRWPGFFMVCDCRPDEEERSMA